MDSADPYGTLYADEDPMNIKLIFDIYLAYFSTDFFVIEFLCRK